MFSAAPSLPGTVTWLVCVFLFVCHGALTYFIVTYGNVKPLVQTYTSYIFSVEKIFCFCFKLQQIRSIPDESHLTMVLYAFLKQCVDVEDGSLNAVPGLHVCFCPFINMCMCVCMCVCLHTTRYVGAYVPAQLCPVVLWSGSWELMRALLSPCLNSSIIHKTLFQQPGYVVVCECVCICAQFVCIFSSFCIPVWVCVFRIDHSCCGFCQTSSEVKNDYQFKSRVRRSSFKN